MGFLDPYKLLIELVAAALLVAGLAFGLWYYGHNRYETGYSTGSAAVVASDRKAAGLARADAAKREAAWTAQLKGATDGYRKEIDALRLQPVRLGPIRLCRYAPVGGRVPETAGNAPGSRPTVPGAGVVQPVPRADNPVRANLGPDIANMLEALAGRADAISAQGRALQEGWPSGNSHP